MNKDKKILIAHYNENLNWINNLNFDGGIDVYSKTINNNDGKFISVNKGQEVPMYLKYIIDNYDNLPKKTLFLHGHYTSQHQDFTSRFICENVNWDCDLFFSVNRREWYQEVSQNYQLSQGAYDVWIKNYWYVFEPFLNFPQEGLFFYSGAQFVVDKSLILQHPKSFYEHLYQWVLTENINLPRGSSDEIISRIFEYSWHYIFTKNHIEPKKQSGEIFKLN
jgi:hypothetical protein